MPARSTSELEDFEARHRFILKATRAHRMANSGLLKHDDQSVTEHGVITWYGRCFGLR